MRDGSDVCAVPVTSSCSCAWCRAACALQCDLEAATIDREKLDAFCREHGFIGWFETSAKKNHNIEASVRFLVRNILSHPDAFEAQRKAQEVRVCVCVTLVLAVVFACVSVAPGLVISFVPVSVSVCISWQATAGNFNNVALETSSEEKGCC